MGDPNKMSTIITITAMVLPVISLTDIRQIYVFRCCTLAGVCFHLLVARPNVEFERFMRRFFSMASLWSGIYSILSAIISHRNLSSILLRLCISWSGFAFGLLSSLLVYRLCFHRCRRFSGPVLAKLTRFYACHLNASQGQFYRKLGQLHEYYGDVVRIGPRELSILDPAALPIIYGPKSQCLKPTFYDIDGDNDDMASINGLRDPTKYRARRRAWDRGMSIKAVQSYQPRIKEQADNLIKQMYSRRGQSIDATAWSMFYSFDVMGDVAFSKDFGNMAAGQENPALQEMHAFITMFGIVQAIPWLPNLLNRVPGATQSVARFYKLCRDILIEKQKSFAVDQEPKDVVSWLLKAIKGKDISASPTPQSLVNDNRTIILAGSDTTANALANALYYITKYKDVQQKLRSQLDAAISRNYENWDYDKVKSVTYIDDIINETLRLKPSLIQGSPRETPKQGLHIGDTYIPGHVVVSVPTILIQRDPRWWKQPEDFIPERFTERREEMGTDDGPWNPFQTGLHACSGRHLAYMSLRTAISAIVQNFELSFAPDEDGKKFDGDFLASFLMMLRPLNLVFTPRSDV